MAWRLQPLGCCHPATVEVAGSLEGEIEFLIFDLAESVSLAAGGRGNGGLWSGQGPGYLGPVLSQEYLGA